MSDAKRKQSIPDDRWALRIPITPERRKLVDRYIKDTGRKAGPWIGLLMYEVAKAYYSPDARKIREDMAKARESGDAA